MPTKRLYDGSSDSGEIQVLTFDQFVSASSSSTKRPPRDTGVTNVSDDVVASAPSDANVAVGTDVEQPSHDVRDDRPFASRSRLYLMVLADFGLSFTWLCKFAVATYVMFSSYDFGIGRE